MGDIPKPSGLPAVVDATPGAVTVSREELEQACTDLGLIRFRPKTIRALKTLGQALETEEIAKIQAAQVIITQESLSKLLKECEDLIDGAELEEIRIDAIKAATAICAESNRSCELTVKMLQSKLLEKESGPVKFRGFKPGDIVVPVQINLNSGQDKKPDGVPAE